jgi:hypothetical protein
MMREIKSLQIYFGLILIILFTACELTDQSLLHSGARKKTVIRINTQSLMNRAQQIKCHSVIDSISLRVTESNQQTQSFNRKITSGQQTLDFPLEVEAGQTDFLVDIYSNNGTLLYRGQRNQDIQEDGFRVNIPLLPVNAILAICYDTLIVSPEITDTFLVANQGINALQWFANTANLPLKLSQTQGSLSEEEQDTVIIYSDTTEYTPGNYALPIQSEVGIVESNIRLLPGTPDLRIVRYSCIENQFVRVYVRNEGTGPTDMATEVKMAFSTSGGTSEFTQELPVLQKSEIYSLDFTIPSGCFIPDCFFLITVDFDDLIEELDEENNSLAGGCFG